MEFINSPVFKPNNNFTVSAQSFTFNILCEKFLLFYPLGLLHLLWKLTKSPRRWENNCCLCYEFFLKTKKGTRTFPLKTQMCYLFAFGRIETMWNFFCICIIASRVEFQKTDLIFFQRCVSHAMICGQLPVWGILLLTLYVLSWAEI